MGDEARHLVLRPGRGVDVRAPELRCQQMPAAEHVERQVTPAVVVAVEEPALLVAVQRIVGGVEVENDLLGRRAVRLQEDIDEDALQRLRVVADLVVAVAAAPRRVLQPVDRALPRQCRAILALRLQLVGEQRQHRITAKGVVVVDVLVPQRDRDDPLADQRRQRVDHLVGAPMIGEACRNAFDQPHRPVRLPQQHRPGIRRHCPAVERRHHLPAIEGFEFELSRATLCLHRTPHRNLATLCRKMIISDSWGRCTPLDEISGLALMSVVNEFGRARQPSSEIAAGVDSECELHRAGDGALETTVDQALIRGLGTAFRVSSRGCSVV